MESPFESTSHVEKEDLSAAGASLRMRRFPSLVETFQDITLDESVPPQVQHRNEPHHQVHKGKPAPLAVGVLLGAFDCEGF